MKAKILELLYQAQASQSEQDRRLVLEEINRSSAVRGTFAAQLRNPLIVKAIMNLALSRVELNAAALSNTIDWNHLFQTDAIARGSLELRNNPALEFFTHTVGIIFAAILEDGTGE